MAAANHASIIDGVRLAKAKRFIYRNNDMADLAVSWTEWTSSSRPSARPWARSDPLFDFSRASFIIPIRL
jgi:7-keto-8-aminopelargonate synthetase-like enzyme